MKKKLNIENQISVTISHEHNRALRTRVIINGDLFCKYRKTMSKREAALKAFKETENAKSMKNGLGTGLLPQGSYNL